MPQNRNNYERRSGANCEFWMLILITYGTINDTESSAPKDFNGLFLKTYILVNYLLFLLSKSCLYR